MNSFKRVRHIIGHILYGRRGIIYVGVALLAQSVRASDC